MTKKIYIIHGWTYTLNAWDACVAELQSLGFEPVMLHVPGLTADTEKSWTLDDYVSWLDASLPSPAELHPGEELVVVGHSNGGRMALALAARKPERISRLVLIASAGIVHNELPLRIRRAVFGAVAKVGKVFRSVPIVRKVFYKLIGATDYGNASPIMRETMKNVISVDLVSELARVVTPTLLIWGDTDRATPPADGQLMNERIAGSKLVLLPGVGHSPHKDQAKRVADEISHFARHING
jgi:pimeloyl-ACP methyl ester carboxylesterase